VSAPLLRLEGLSKQYGAGEPYALNGVDLTIEDGELVAVLGLSGSGKSTLIRCVNGLVTPTRGRIHWRGRDVTDAARPAWRETRRQIGMIFQDFHLIDRLTVLRNVLAGTFGTVPAWRALLGRHTDAELYRAHAALEQVGLTALAGRRARDLSGGQRQRVAIARALVQVPRLILGDEPVSNLDPVTAHSIMGLLDRLNREHGITLVLNLHSVELARAFAARVIGLCDGLVVFDGPPEELTGETLLSIYGKSDPDAAMHTAAVAAATAWAAERSGATSRRPRTHRTPG
jgi:phosphonate transport system ATP-binding protein